MKKLIPAILAIVLSLTVLASVMAAGTLASSDNATAQGFAFHCNAGNGNGRTYLVGYAKDFGKYDKKTGEGLVNLVRSADPKVWNVIVPEGETWKCLACGGTEWISFSNKSGVPDGKNIQLFHPSDPFDPGDPEVQAIIRYYAICQLWNDLVWGFDGFGLGYLEGFTGPYDPLSPRQIGDKNEEDLTYGLFPVGVAHRTALMAYWKTDDKNVRYVPFGNLKDGLFDYVEWANRIRYEADADGVSLQSVCDKLGIDIEAFIKTYDTVGFLDRNNLWK